MAIKDLYWSLLAASFLLFTSCFANVFSLHPCGLHLSPHASSSASGGSDLRLEAKTGAHTTESDFLLSLFAVVFRRALRRAHSARERCAQVLLYNREAFSSRQLHSSSHMSESCQAASSRLCHTFGPLLSHHVENGFYSYANIFSHIT